MIFCYIKESLNFGVEINCTSVLIIRFDILFTFVYNNIYILSSLLLHMQCFIAAGTNEAREFCLGVCSN